MGIVRKVIVAMLLHALLILPLFLASYGMDGYVENCDDTCVSSCKPNWTEVDSHCYLWSKIQLSWAEAETACMKEGGHLASITSKAMNDKISNETKTNHRGHTSMWIGGTDSEKEGTWTWSDCSEWKFELWMQVSEGMQPKTLPRLLAQLGGRCQQHLCGPPHHSYLRCILCLQEKTGPHFIVVRCPPKASISHLLLLYLQK